MGRGGHKTIIKVTAIKGWLVNAIRNEKITKDSIKSILNHILVVILECKLRYTQCL